MAKIRIKKYAGGGSLSPLGPLSPNIPYGKKFNNTLNLNFDNIGSNLDLGAYKSPFISTPLEGINTDDGVLNRFIDAKTNRDLKASEMFHSLEGKELTSTDRINNIMGDQQLVIPKEETFASYPKDNKFKNLPWGDIATGAAMLAPAIGSAANLIKGDYEPEQTRLPRMSAPEKLQAEEISTTQLDPTFSSAYNKAMGNIVSTSGGSGAAARANIAGTAASLGRSKSQAISDIIKYNQQQRTAANQFNIGNQQQVNQINTGIAKEEALANEMNKATAENQKRQDWANLFSSIGNVGKTLYQGKQISRGTGYSPWTGKKIQ